MALQPSRAWVIGGLVALLGFSVGAGMMLRNVELPPAARWATALLVCGAGFWLICAYWRVIDEAAKEAQKWAWLWGGSAGMAASFLLLVSADRGLVDLDALIPAGQTPVELLILGAGAVVFAQLAGFFVAWAFWWWRRR